MPETIRVIALAKQGPSGPTGPIGPPGEDALVSSLALTVKSKDDLPAPIAGVITSPDNKTLFVVENIDLGTDRLVIGSGGSITGIRRSGGAATVISGTTTPALVTATTSGDYLDIGFNQLGTGDVFNIDGVAGGAGTQFLFTRAAFEGGLARITEGFFNSFNTCNFSGGAGIVLDGASNATFLGIRDTTIFSDQANGDVMVRIESGAVLQRLLIDTASFDLSFVSKGIVVENGATLQFLEVLNAAANLFNAGATGIELADPDAIGLGLLSNVTFGPGASGIPIASSPVFDAKISFPAADVTILNGNLWSTEFGSNFAKHVGISSTVDTVFPFGGSIGGITNDGVNIIVADDSGDLITVMVGESNTVDFSFAAPGSKPIGLAFDGQDIWVVDNSADRVYQLEGKSATVKNSWPTLTSTAGGLDVDGTVVMVSRGNSGHIDVHKLDGTFLYSFLTDFNFGGGIAHQEDEYVFVDIAFAVINIYSKNIAFHEGSKNWKIEDSNISTSATRIVSRFSSPGTTVTPSLVNEWTDIQDAGASIVWGAAAEGFEKFLVSDVINGTVKSVGAREMANVVSANLQLARSTGSTISIQLGIFLNGILIEASMFPLVLDTNNRFTPTIPSIILKLAVGDEIVLRFKNITNTNAVDFFSGILSA